ncbi:MAG: hypothetical protein JRD89_01975 [Deltaproteobacteria bacterium]|nr:hypothetical protein [Deltaproteobacteria bacterium]
MDYSITTHNGEITMENPETGKHRTIRIKTQKDDDNFAPGERIAYLLNGHNNERDYLPFAFVKTNGRVIVWKKFRGDEQPSSYEKLATMIADPVRFEERGIRYLFSTSCRRCNRLLTTPESIQNGIGPTCATK